MFKVIPVIDIYNGIVVHARHGERNHYHAIQSQLTPSHQPIDIVDALLAVYPFEQLYIADLNAILHGDNQNLKIIDSICLAFPKLSLWLDAGIQNTTDIQRYRHQQLTLIAGSENIANLASYQALKEEQPDIHLSLDFLPNGYKGPQALIQSADRWPDDVIVMTLENVGSNQGCHQSKLKEVLALRTTQRLYAAGGVRNIDDLCALKKMKLQGALVASALHNKQLKKSDIEHIQQ